MAASLTTSSVYLHVIEDVINKVRDEFVNNGGPGGDVLSDLQGLWEAKMMQAGVILGPADRPVVPKPPPAGAAAPVHDLNVPYEGEEYETPTADMLFPPTPLQTPMPTPLPGTVDSSMYNIPTGSSDYPTPRPESASNPGENAENKTGGPGAYMQSPSPWTNQRPSLGVDVNVDGFMTSCREDIVTHEQKTRTLKKAYVEGREDIDRGTSRQTLTKDLFVPPSGKRKRDDLVPPYQNGGFIPQQDGADDTISEALQVKEENALLPIADQGNREMLANIEISLSGQKIPQLDGQIPDPYDDMLSTPNIYNYQGVVNEDYNVASTPMTNELQAATPAHLGNNDEPGDDDDEPLNENDDDDLDDVDEEEEVNTQHFFLAQFDKVTRTKSRWKCTLKDGIMHINNKDILFNKATGEFEF